MRLFAATTACVMALAVGGSAAAATAQLPPAYEFILVFERSGGLAPSTQSLTVAPGGFAVAESGGTRAGERHAEFHLADRRIRSLQRGLRDAHLGSIPSPGTGSCADCYLYSIFYQGDYLKLDESEVPPRLGKVIDEIEAIISAHTIPPNARVARG
jgi:hypothetical protein